MTRLQNIALVALASVGAVALPARPVRAQDEAAIDKLVQMNKKALEDYDTLDWEAARRILLDALVAGKKAGLDNHPIVGRTYIHLGAVYITGFHDRQKGLQSFGRALAIDPAIQLSKGIDTPEVVAAFADAQRIARGGGGQAGGNDQESAAPPPPPRRHRGPIMEDENAGAAPEAQPRQRRHVNNDEEPDLPARISALDCPTPDEAIIDRPLTLRCVVAPNLPVDSVFLLYRAPGKESYKEELMTRTPKGWLQAKIPKKAVTGKSLQFYFEGRSAAGKPVVANGGADSPNIVLVVEPEEAGEAAEAGSGDEEENPLEESEGPHGPRLRLGHVNKDLEGLDTRYGKRKWWIGIGIGSGYGFAKGNGFEAVNNSPENACSTPNCVPFHALQAKFQQGLAWAGIAHLAPEIGYAFTPDIALSVEGRLQYLAQPAKYSQFAAKAAIGAMAKLIFYTKQSKLRFFGTILGGGGNFRFIGYPAVGTDFSDFKDTIVAGPVLVGLGGGVYYEASKAVSLVAELHELVGLPTIGAVTDLNVGLQFNIYASAPPASREYVPTGLDQEDPK